MVAEQQPDLFTGLNNAFSPLEKLTSSQVLEPRDSFADQGPNQFQSISSSQAVPEIAMSRAVDVQITNPHTDVESSVPTGDFQTEGISQAIKARRIYKNLSKATSAD